MHTVFLSWRFGIRKQLSRPTLSPPLVSLFASSFSSNYAHKTPAVKMNLGDLNNTSAMRVHSFLEPDPQYNGRSLAISEAEDDIQIRSSYRPYLLGDAIAKTDWIAQLELSTTLKMVEANLQSDKERLKVLVLYGSLRKRSD
jgi:hypothetical protein